MVITYMLQETSLKKAPGLISALSKISRSLKYAFERGEGDSLSDLGGQPIFRVDLNCSRYMYWDHRDIGKTWRLDYVTSTSAAQPA